MIPTYEPKDMADAIEFYQSSLRNIEVLAQTHIRWYTHKNPFGCWICDLLHLCNKVIDLYYPKSTLDIMNENVQDSTKVSHQEELM